MSHFRWLVIFLAFVAIVITYLDRVALSFAIIPLENLYHLTNADFGIIASAFGIGYLVMTVAGGVLVDRYGSRKIWSISAIFWSLACASIGFATGFIWLFISRLLLGLMEGPGFPALNRMNADWLPMSERARALGLGLAAVPFASVIGAPLISSLIIYLGWRWMFIILGMLGILWGLIWYIIFRDKPKQSAHVSKSELEFIEKGLGLVHKKQVKSSWKFLLFNPVFLANNFAFFSFGYLLFFAITWLPGYLEQTYAMKIKETGIFLIAPWVLATILILIGGWLSDYLWNKTHSMRLSRSHMIWICQILSACCFIPVIWFHSLTIAIIGISLGVGIGLMPNAAFYAVNSDLAHDRAGTSLGIMDCAFAAAGILAPLLTGLLSSLTGNFSLAIFLLIGLSFISAIGIVLFHHPDKVLQK